MAITRKTYSALADAFARAIIAAEAGDEEWGSTADAIYNVTHVLALDNPRFDGVKFGERIQELVAEAGYDAGPFHVADNRTGHFGPVCTLVEGR